MPQTVFIADLHLSDDTPELNRLFLQTLQNWQGKVDALYILGDFFEVWLGDDILSDIAVEAAAALKTFGQTAPVYFICGNRDFLLGSSYAKQAGITLLPEVREIELYGTRYLISHGDEMCTADVSYQRFRRMIRRPTVQKLLLALPQSPRRKIAAKIRAASKEKK
ncbi:UDP-2,3-diacylglucosamine diphosphatase, partial [Neisseria dentiae]|uniref:UDP-2,3-diacylglucosamine diphosphatase n=1 Tax=Neisseria dentiae TaxID=194197 RepID=UPI0035A13331